MSDKAFPSVNDLGGGKTLTEANLRDFMAGLMSGSGAFVVSGFVPPGSSGTLNLLMPLGVCYVDGYRIEADAESIALPGNQTSYVYLQYSIDGSSNITSHGLVSNTTGITPARAILLATATTGPASVISTVDRRKVGFSVFAGYQPQAMTEVTVPATSSGTTNIVNVTEQGHFWAFYMKATGLGSGSSTLRLKITVDGSTEYSVDIATVSGGLTWTVQAQTLSGLANADSSADVLVISFNIFYRVSLKVDIESTGSSTTGSYAVKLQRSKAV